MSAIWVFGYGSLMWRPDFEFLRQMPARLPGFQRRFWQGSHDHRGLPDAPGRVVTLVPAAHAACDGIAYLIDADIVVATFEALDRREKNGYERVEVLLQLAGVGHEPGLVYIAAERNFAWLGDTGLPDMARQIAVSHGPSGSNADYLFQLADALRALQSDDPHVFALETQVRELLDV